MLSSFRSKHPMVRYKIYSGNVQNVKDQIERGLLDIGLLIEPTDIRKYEFLRMSLKEEWGVLVSADSGLASKEAIHPKDLLQQPLIISEGVNTNALLRDWFGDYNDRMEFVATYNLLHNAAILVQKKMGVAICLRLRGSYENLRFIPLAPAVKASSVLVWKKNQPYSPATTAFLDFASEMLKRHLM